jgi:hypothetical protein
MEVNDVTWTDPECSDKSSDEKTSKKINEKMRRINEKINEKINGKTDEKAKESSIEVIEKDLYSSLPLHCRKTLSEFYYGTCFKNRSRSSLVTFKSIGQMKIQRLSGWINYGC